MGNVESDAEEDLPDNDTCTSSIDMEHYLHYSLVPSVIIIIVLSCLERRLRRWSFDGKLKRLCGRCGVVIPFDFVSMFSHRWSFGFAFGATADKLMILFTEDFPKPENMPSWAKVFWVLLIAIEVGLSSYPLFACLSTKYQKTGAVLGFLYTSSWSVVMLIDVVQCPHGDSSFLQGYESVVLFLPSFLCQFFLLVRFLHIFVKSLNICGWQAVHNETDFLEIHQIQHVQRLMKKPPSQPPEKTWIQKKLYEWDPYFKFPSRMISTSVVVLICLYIFITMEVTAFVALSQLSRMLVSQLDPLLPDELQRPNSNTSYLQEFVEVADGVWVATTVSSTLTCVTYVFHILACYRKHIKRLRVGKKSFLLSDFTKVSHSLSVVALARYSSWQIAYTIWGYFIMHLVQWVAVMVLMYLVVLPMKHNQWKELLDKWGITILTFFLVMIVKRLQLLMAGRFFLQPKISPTDKAKPLALDNRKVFQNFTYFLFFYTVVVGMVSCLFRLLRSIVVGAWLIGRIDRTVMPKGYEACDMGFKTWVGMLLMDHYHTNPCLVYFCHILVKRNQEKELQRVTQFSRSELKETGCRVSARARTRWLLFYTLLNNPSLTKFRKPKSSPQSEFPDKVVCLMNSAAEMVP